MQERIGEEVIITQIPGRKGTETRKENVENMTPANKREHTSAWKEKCHQVLMRCRIQSDVLLGMKRFHGKW